MLAFETRRGHSYRVWTWHGVSGRFWPGTSAPAGVADRLAAGDGRIERGFPRRVPSRHPAFNRIARASEPEHLVRGIVDSGSAAFLAIRAERRASASDPFDERLGFGGFHGFELTRGYVGLRADKFGAMGHD